VGLLDVHVLHPPLDVYRGRLDNAPESRLGDACRLGLRLDLVSDLAREERHVETVCEVRSQLCDGVTGEVSEVEDDQRAGVGDVVVSEPS